MSLWDHLFLSGEFRGRKDLLSGLTLEQVKLRPTGASHSIYEELWHVATIQRCIVEQDKALDAVLRAGANYPSAPPDDGSNGATWCSSSWKPRKRRSRGRKSRPDWRWRSSLE